jgi:excinuclease ABC subunit C
MQKYSDNLEFEKAATVRNRLKSLGDFTAKQKVVSPELKDRDIFGIARSGDFACTLVFIVREGKLIGKRHFLISKAGLESDEEILQRTIEKYYLETIENMDNIVPKEIMLPNEVDDLEYILDWLGKKQPLTVQLPKIGDKRKLVEMANTNAEFLLKDFILSFEKRDKIIPHSVLALQRDLNLAKPPRRIECFDNSHFQGSDMVSSMVVFVDGKPKKSEYRKFKPIRNDKLEIINCENLANNDDNQSTQLQTEISNLSFLISNSERHNDDFAMMRETVERRFLRAIEEKQELPDLVIVDGGKGQLSSAFSVLEKLGLSQTVAIIGLAKRLEEVFKPNSSLPILLPKTSSSLKLLQQLRDEAHRFAITFHRQLRDKRAVQSELLEIKGIGKITMKKLINKFGSVKDIKEASEEELQEVLNVKQYEALKEFFAEK